MYIHVFLLYFCKLFTLDYKMLIWIKLIGDLNYLGIINFNKVWKKNILKKKEKITLYATKVLY